MFIALYPVPVVFLVHTADYLLQYYASVTTAGMHA